ncbi:aminotransferase class I/II-fold pyridoxal phosphate-dependent enzyme [Ktedonosporobacter rubrisoli]|uniref:Aminotransferase class I/II-fold pyridoxal phosphate-dependent enzyme n=1 Tax=Ktedonosporobacter rubrisoli TaxID=2509675 RepID=A0A4P6JKA0_KTERU|nr:GntG family PLP-dependent aldolase [Ktedonosporobacter rubrisoli]QBD75575.1 aminotransferase class I/II-fold pyridoxal phosphate-dependent enzyme [Ktedonosporobacter rubrisoli]
MIDLSSDTVTRPTEAMRRVMARAEVGDEQKGEDPTVNMLQDVVAELLGKEAALYLPTGTMCNNIAIKAHTQPADAILVDRQAHILRSESAGLAALSNVLVDQIDGDRGRFTAEQVARAITKGSLYAAPTRLLCVEQTHNFGGGTIWPLAQLRAVCEVARARGIATHMDGARLLNAVVATGMQARDYAACCDSVWIDFSKGLGAPGGAVLAGSAAFIQQARRYKHVFGGAQRQAGIIAAAGLYALSHHVERLCGDHENAKILADGLGSIPGVQVELPVETNMVFFDVRGAGLSHEAFLANLQSHRVRVGSVGDRLRAVTHLDVSQHDIQEALAVIKKVCRKQDS